MMLISPNYRRLLEKDHEASPHWGTTGARYRDHILALCRAHSTSDVLDYGCGKGRLADALGIECSRYDPGIVEHSSDPRPHDIVVSTDVLEHVELACIDSVLEHIRSLTLVAGFHAISTTKAHHRLPNGKNAHLIVRPADWWCRKLEIAGFSVSDVRLDMNAPRYEEVVYTVEVIPV